jgi:hypothetical protein
MDLSHESLDLSHESLDLSHESLDLSHESLDSTQIVTTNPVFKRFDLNCNQESGKFSKDSSDFYKSNESSRIFSTITKLNPYKSKIHDHNPDLQARVPGFDSNHDR